MLNSYYKNSFFLNYLKCPSKNLYICILVSGLQIYYCICRFKSIAGEQEEISCIVFCDPDDSYSVNVIRDINCSNIDPLIVPSVVGEFELLVSSITQLSSSVTTEFKAI